MKTSISGKITQIKWSSPNRSVFRVQDEKRNMHTVVGRITNPIEGMAVVIDGELVHDPKYGKQVKASNILARRPAPKDKAVAYLASGILPNVGQAIAARMYDAFGEDVFKVLTSEPSRLAEVKGISKEKASAIAAAWKQASPIHEVGRLLSELGVGREMATKANDSLKRKFKDVAGAIRENPYVLADVPGIGFKKADQAARKLKLKHDDEGRILAGLSAAVAETATHGHTRVSQDDLIRNASRLLRIAPEPIAAKLPLLIQAEVLKTGRDQSGQIELSKPSLFWAEYRIAEEIERLRKGPPILPGEFSIDDIVHGAKLSFEPSLKQKRAISTLLSSKVSVLTGGPGCGKSACMAAVMHAAESANLKITLAAPTGRAAVRLSQATDRPATTIHTLLGYRGLDGRLTYHAGNKIDTMMITIDEMSMADVEIFAKLLAALPDHTRVVLVGDPDQLPSVQPGNVLHDLIDSGVIPVGELTEVFRQGTGSGIALGAKEVIAGRMPHFTDDFDFVELDRANAVCDYVVERTVGIIRETGSLGSVQVLCPQRRKSEVGADHINQVIQQELFGAASGLQVGGRGYHRGDKVIQTRNNRELNIYNGDIGIIQDVNTARRGVAVAFETEMVDLDGTSLYDLDLAYGITIHKSQGGQFPHVIMPVHSSNANMLHRRLLYTGITRAETTFTMVGDTRGLELALSNVMYRERRTGLSQLLRDAAAGRLGRHHRSEDVTRPQIPSDAPSRRAEAASSHTVDSGPEHVPALELDLFDAPAEPDPFEKHRDETPSPIRKKQTFSL